MPFGAHGVPVLSGPGFSGPELVYQYCLNYHLNYYFVITLMNLRL